MSQVLSALPRRTIRSTGTPITVAPDRRRPRRRRGRRSARSAPGPGRSRRRPTDLVDSSQASSDGPCLEVVAEGEVAVHLEEGAVPGGLADLFDVLGPDALLDAGRPLPRRGLLADEVRHELHHAGVDEQQVRVVERQRGARHHGVAVGLEVREKAPPDLGRAHGGCSLSCLAIRLAALRARTVRRSRAAVSQCVVAAGGCARPAGPRCRSPGRPPPAARSPAPTWHRGRRRRSRAASRPARSARRRSWPAMPCGVSFSAARDSLRKISTPRVAPRASQNSRRMSAHPPPAGRPAAATGLGHRLGVLPLAHGGAHAVGERGHLDQRAADGGGHDRGQRGGVGGDRADARG